MPTDTWEEHRATRNEQAGSFIERLADQGALDEAEDLWDALDAGENPFEDARPVDEVIADARQHAAR
jgi:hypothetical protein